MADILQWNVRGLRARAEELKVLLRDHDPGILCLQETKLGDGMFNLGLNYSLYRSAPPAGDRAKGGAAVAVHKRLQHSAIALNTNLQAVAVRVTLEKEITICSIYLPPDFNYSVADVQFLINQLPGPFFLLGDFNAHNPLWDNRVGVISDNKGQVIEDLVDNNTITILNDGSSTYHNIHLNVSTAIDLSICSSSIMLDFIWSVDEFLNGSDHFPIFLKKVENAFGEHTPRWKIEEAKWADFKKGCEITREFESFDSNLKAYDHFTDTILKSAESSIPKTNPNPQRPPVPWWDDTCWALRKATRKCYKKYKHSGSPHHKVLYQKAQAEQRKYFKKVKKDSWIHYINGINSKTALGSVWKKIRKLNGKFVPSPLPTLKINNNLISEPEEVANHLGKHFSDISNPKSYSNRFQRVRNAQVSLNFDGDDAEPYNMHFSMREFKEALSSTENTSPGEDTIMYEMIKHIPDSAREFLLKILNRIWETSILPRSWKISIIIAIHKPGKDAYQPTSYRPIALTSCICKLFEKMVNNRLVWLLETKDLLAPTQFGFRKNRSTLDSLVRLSTHIQQGFVNQKQTIGVFFDLEKAYDTTWRYGILRECKRMGIKGKMIRFIKGFLSDRYIKVRVGGKLSRPFKQVEGVPQGSVLSVTLFSIAINSIVETVSRPVGCTLFVDDFAIYCSSHDAVTACSHLQKTLDAISKWADNNGFKFSVQKTTAIRFTRSRRIEHVPNLYFKGSLLPLADQVKFLGVIFDKKLTFAAHIDNLKTKVKKSLNILKVVSSYDWGADKKTLLKLYNSLCKSKLDYACEVYSSACKTKLYELDVVHNLGLRFCTGAFRTSPVESIYVDAEELPLDLRREELGLRYMNRLKSNSTYKIPNVCNSRQFEKPRCSKPFLVRIHKQVNQPDLKNQKIDQTGYLKVPPWLVPEVNTCEKTISKKTQSDEEIRMRFLDHNSQHRDQQKIYTDGSKSSDGVGSAVVYGEEVFCAKLSDHASVFTAEMHAINKALSIVNSSPYSDFVIYTDSLSSVNAIKRLNSFHPLIQKAQEWLFRIATKHKTIKFCWVPSHVGISGNEKADSEARVAATLNENHINGVPHSDMKRPIRHYIQRKWQERWSALTTNRKYRKIRPSIEHWSSSYHPNRRIERSLSRLRIGHTWLTHHYILEGQRPPECDQCHVPISVEHILVECTKFQRGRRRFSLENKTIETLLGNDGDINLLMSFLKEIDVFYNI